jgi:hypothetical protein
LISEDRALKKCLYCGASIDLSDWKTYFHARKHYKVIKCKCGRGQHVTVGVNSSGHDNWIKEKSLEDKV